MMDIDIRISYDVEMGEATYEWDVDEELYQELDADAEFEMLLNELALRFKWLVEAHED